MNRDEIDEMYRPLPRTAEDDAPRSRPIPRLVSGAPALARIAAARALLAEKHAPANPFAA